MKIRSNPRKILLIFLQYTEIKKNGGFEWKIKETIIKKIKNWYVVNSVQGPHIYSYKFVD
jgi:hypothetical protein